MLKSFCSLFMNTDPYTKALQILSTSVIDSADGRLHFISSTTPEAVRINSIFEEMVCQKNVMTRLSELKDLYRCKKLSGEDFNQLDAILVKTGLVSQKEHLIVKAQTKGNLWTYQEMVSIRNLLTDCRRGREPIETFLSVYTEPETNYDFEREDLLFLLQHKIPLTHSLARNALSKNLFENSSKQFLDKCLLLWSLLEIDFTVINKQTDFIEKAQTLVGFGADLDAQDSAGNTPLICTLKRKGLLTHVLLSNGADLNKKNKKGESPLSIYCQNEHADINRVFYYIEKGAMDLEVPFKNHNSLLEYIAAIQNPSSFILLLNRQAFFGELFFSKYYPFLTSVAKTSRELHNQTVDDLMVVQWLEKQGGRFDISKGRSQQHKKDFIINLFQQDPKIILHYLSYYQLPLEVSPAALLLCLIEGITSLRQEHFRLFDLFIDKLPNKNALLTRADFYLSSEDFTPQTLLDYVMQEEDLNAYDLIFYLISKGFDVNHPSKKGNTPLHLCFEYGLQELALPLMMEKADPFIRNFIGKTPVESFIQSDMQQEVAFCFPTPSNIHRYLKLNDKLPHIFAVHKNLNPFIFLYSVNASFSAAKLFSGPRYRQFFIEFTKQHPKLNLHALIPNLVSFTNFYKNKERPPIPLAPKTYLGQLMYFFNQIQFDEEKKAGHCSPRSLLVDDNEEGPATPEELRNNLSILIKSVINRTPVAGAPNAVKDKAAFERFYDEIENLLHHLIRYAQSTNDLDRRNSIVLHVATASTMCGSRWIAELHLCYDHQQEDPSGFTLDDKIHLALRNYRRQIIESVSVNEDVHVYNFLLNRLNNECGLGIPSSRNLPDPLLSESEKDDFVITARKAFRENYNAYTVVRIVVQELTALLNSSQYRNEVIQLFQSLQHAEWKKQFRAEVRERCQAVKAAHKNTAYYLAETEIESLDTHPMVYVNNILWDEQTNAVSFTAAIHWMEKEGLIRPDTDGLFNEVSCILQEEAREKSLHLKVERPLPSAEPAPKRRRGAKK